MGKNEAWKSIFARFQIDKHNFDEKPFYITNANIKEATKHFSKTGEKEVRILCYQTKREDRPEIFIDNDLFILPVKNGQYVITKGEGYIDIPVIRSKEKIYKSKLDFHLDTVNIGNSEMQHIDFSYATSLIRTFTNDNSLVLTIRGRKYTPKFNFLINNYKIEVTGVQTEVDAGYEGKEQVVLVEAKNTDVNNTIIRQLYYPFRQWKTFTNKKIICIFFEKNADKYNLWQFEFEDEMNYNSIKLIKSETFIIQ